MQSIPHHANLNAIAAVSVAVIHDGLALLIRRKVNPARNLWAFPGGRVEAGEELIEAAERELFEETNLRGSDFNLLKTIDIVPAGPGNPLYRLHVFTCGAVKGSVKAGDDAAEAGWFDLEKMENLPMTVTTLEICKNLLGGNG